MNTFIKHLKRWSRPVLGATLGLGLLLAARPASAALNAPETPAGMVMAPFALDRVQLLDGPFKVAMEANARYLHLIEADRLLHNSRPISTPPHCNRCCL